MSTSEKRREEGRSPARNSGERQQNVAPWSIRAGMPAAAYAAAKAPKRLSYAAKLSCCAAGQWSHSLPISTAETCGQSPARPSAAMCLAPTAGEPCCRLVSITYEMLGAISAKRR